MLHLLNMKILQLNIWSGKLGKPIIDLLNSEKPDVVCFQEAVELEGGRNFLFEDIDSIKEKAGYDFSDFSAQIGYKLMNRKVKMGLSILSKHSFIQTDEIFTRLGFTDDFDLIDGDYNVRSLQRVTIDWEGEKLHIINHHGHHVHGHKDGNEETMSQCGMIVDYINNLEGSVVLCGDFNLSPTSPSLEQISKVLNNHVKNSEIETTRNYLTKKEGVCDYIFTSSSIEAKNLQVHDEIVSDHQAITIEINKKATP